MSALIDVSMLALLTLLCAACAVLLWQLRLLRQRAAHLERQVIELEPAAPLPANLAQTFGAGSRRVIAVEILNPVELATAKVRAAAVLGAVAPETLRRIVYDQALKIVVEQLRLQGVDADVRVHEVP